MTADCSEDQQRQEMCLDEAPLCQAGTPADIGSQVCANTDQYRLYQVSGPWVEHDIWEIYDLEDFH